MAQVLKVELSLRGQPIRSFTFTTPTVTIGRDPRSRLYLDNPSVSRDHARLHVTREGIVVEDAGSANGTHVNEQPVERALVGEGDVVQIGKFSLGVALSEVDLSRGADRTTALRPDELARVMSSSRVPSAPPPPATPSHAQLIAATVVASSIGAVVGALAMWVAVHGTG